MDQTTPYGEQVQAAVDAIERSGACYVTRIEGIFRSSCLKRESPDHFGPATTATGAVLSQGKV